MAVHIEPFGEKDGCKVSLFTLKAESRLGPIEIAVMEYGATLVRCIVPDSAGQLTDVALGYDRLEDYVAGRAYFGATVGRYGNRIGGSRIVLDNEEFELVPNEGANQLHGGPVGFDKVIWSGSVLEVADAVRFDYVAADDEMGFPGRLPISVTYAIMREGCLAIDIEATTDRSTLCNPVHHTYWNLGGHASGTVLGHLAKFNAPFYTPVGDNLLATGEICAVDGTPFDFREAKAIGTHMGEDGKGRASLVGGAYDHNLVLDQLQPTAAEIVNQVNGLGMRLTASEPGVQFYTGGYLGPEVIGKGGQPYCRYGGFTLETQKFPCSPAFSHFPSARLNPGEAYHHRMRFVFFHLSRSL